MIHRFSFIVIIIIICLQKSIAQVSFPLSFEDGFMDTIQFLNNDPESIHKSFTTFSLLEFNSRSYKSTNSYSTSISFALTLKYERFINGNKGMIYGKFGYLALESIKSERDWEYELTPIFGEVGYKFSLGSRTKSKVRKLNFYNQNQQNFNSLNRQNYMHTTVIHRAALPVKYKVQYYLRMGALYDQYTDDREFTIDNNHLSLESDRSCTFSLGLSRQKIGYLHFKSKGFGEQQAAWLTDFYVDFLYSPILLGYGHYYLENDHTVIEESRLSGSLLSFSRFGFRLGGSRKSSFIRSKNLAPEYFYEIGFLPGINGVIETFVFGCRLSFLSKD